MKTDEEKQFDLFTKIAKGLQNQINKKNENLQDNIRSIIGSYPDNKQKVKVCQKNIDKLNKKFLKGSVDVRKYANTLLNEFEIAQRPVRLNEWVLQTCDFFYHPECQEFIVIFRSVNYLH